MRNDNDVLTHNHGTTKRRTPLQIEALEGLYSDDKYPSSKAMGDLALSINLTYKQVRGWFIERRRKEKRDTSHKKGALSSSKRNSLLSSNKYDKLYASDLQYRVRGDDSQKIPIYTNKSTPPGKKRKVKQRVTHLQEHLLSLDFILKKVFRKDGPPLGVKFDPLPFGAFGRNTTGPTDGLTCERSKRVIQKRKVSSSPISSFEVNNELRVPMMKHGMGKGLMTVWRATNPGAQCYPTDANSIARDGHVCLSSTSAKSTKPLRREKKKPRQTITMKQGVQVDKLLTRRRRAVRNTKVSSNAAAEKPHLAECKLAVEGMRYQEYPNTTTKLVDDEELELRELQAGPNPLTCSAHLACNGMHTCSLCKDLLARFPPHSVKMKQPFCVQPWSSSLELVKKLFKVFRFLYSHSSTFDICSFTLDEFSQAFHDKDSLLLGKIHVALLKILFSDVEMELRGEFFPHASRNFRFIGFLHLVKQQEFILNMWSRYLNPMTWTEILRQVLVAAGFNSKQGRFRREPMNKDENRLAQYGLCPGTLKGEMFNILSEQGSNGLHVTELAKDLRVVELHLTNTTEELELLIRSTLSSDITLFEKISTSAYRLRSNLLTDKGAGYYLSDSEVSGSIDGASQDSITNSSDESELDSARTSLSIIKHQQRCTKKSNMLTEYTEIDESDSGELWVLALMEGEYSDLSLEEKLNTLVALVDLTSAGSSVRVETPGVTEKSTAIQHHGGAKIKRLSNKQKDMSRSFWGNHAEGNVAIPLDISEPLNCVSKSDFCRPDGSKVKGVEEVEIDGHPLQSIYLGSDRRFNNYWIFLGPCNGKDPGHRRIYFESSEDGHWEVIDTTEALVSLLLVLDGRGSREARLLAALKRLEAFLCDAMSVSMSHETDTSQLAKSDQSSIVISGDGSSPISDVDNNLCRVDTGIPSSGAIVLDLRNVEEQKRKWDCLQAFDVWIWKSFYSNLNAVKYSKRSYHDSLIHCASCHDLYWRDEKHCKICHTTFELDFDLEERYAVHVATCKEKDDCNMFPKHRVLSTQLQSLKAALHAIEEVMRKEALVSAWTTSDHKLWVTRLKRSSSLSELLQVLTDFVGAINEDWLCQCNRNFDCDTAGSEMIESFPAIPQTTSAVALWLVKLDALIAPYLQRVNSEQAQAKSTQQKKKVV